MLHYVVNNQKLPGNKYQTFVHYSPTNMVKHNQEFKREAKRLKVYRETHQSTQAQKQRAVTRANDSRANEKPWQKKRRNKRRVRRRQEVGRGDRTSEHDRIYSSAQRVYRRLFELERTRGANSFDEYRATMRSSLTPPDEKAKRVADIRYAHNTMRSSKKRRERFLDVLAYFYGGQALKGHLRRHLERIKATQEPEEPTDDEETADDEPVNVEAQDSSSDDDDDGDNGPGAASLAVGVTA